MKITLEHYEKMKQGIEAHIESNQPVKTLRMLEHNPTAKEILEDGRDRGVLNQARWELLYTCEIDGMSGLLFVCDVLCHYVNDSHIQTALNNIIPE
jgi:hypothetical protein